MNSQCRRRGEAVEKQKGGEKREKIIGKGKKTKEQGCMG
jgi:hypothetical protein